MLLGTVYDLLSSASRLNWYNIEFKIFTLVGKTEEAGVEFIPRYLSKLGEQNADQKTGMSHAAFQHSCHGCEAQGGFVDVSAAA